MKMKSIVSKEAHILAAWYDLIHCPGLLKNHSYAYYFGDMSKFLYFSYVVEGKKLWIPLLKCICLGISCSNPLIQKVIDIIKSIEVCGWREFEEYIKIECSNIQFPTTVRYMFNIELVENTYSILNYLMTILYFFKYTYTPFHFPDYKHFNDVVRDFLKIEKEYIVKFERYGTYWFIPLRRNRINKLFLDILKIGSVSQPTIDLFLT